MPAGAAPAPSAGFESLGCALPSPQEAAESRFINHRVFLDVVKNKRAYELYARGGYRSLNWLGWFAPDPVVPAGVGEIDNARGIWIVSDDNVLRAYDSTSKTLLHATTFHEVETLSRATVDTKTGRLLVLGRKEDGKFTHFWSEDFGKSILGATQMPGPVFVGDENSVVSCYDSHRACFVVISSFDHGAVDVQTSAFSGGNTFGPRAYFAKFVAQTDDVVVRSAAYDAQTGNILAVFKVGEENQTFESADLGFSWHRII